MIPTFGSYAGLVRLLAVELHRAIYVDYEEVSETATADAAQSAVEHAEAAQNGGSHDVYIGSSRSLDTSGRGEARHGAGAGAGAGSTGGVADSGQLPGVRSGTVIGGGQSEMYLPSVASASPRPPPSMHFGASAAAGLLASPDGANNSLTLDSAAEGLGGAASLDYFRGTTYFTKARVLKAEIEEMTKRRASFSAERQWMAAEMERRKFVFDITVRHWQRGLPG